MAELQNLEKKEDKRNKRRPWDDDPDLDRCLERWKAEKKFDPAWNPTGMLEVSSFSRAYPKCREKHLLNCWPRVKSALKEHGVSCELNLVERYMTVSTTKKTRDPYIIVKARDLLRLMARSVPSRQALKILEDGMAYDIIDIRRWVVRIRSKALETSTNCFIRMQGNTVAAMGSFRGLTRVRIIVETCFRCQMRPLDVLRKMDAGEQLRTRNGFEEMDANVAWLF